MPGRKFSISTSASSTSLSIASSPRVGLEVEHDGALVAAEQLPRVRVAALGREPTHAPHTVARGRFDLDDVGAEVGEVAGRARTGEHRRHVDDAQPLERLHHVDRVREAAIRERTERVVAIQAREHVAGLLGPRQRVGSRRCAA